MHLDWLPLPPIDPRAGQILSKFSLGVGFQVCDEVSLKTQKFRRSCPAMFALTEPEWQVILMGMFNVPWWILVGACCPSTKQANLLRMIANSEPAAPDASPPP